MNFTLDDTAPQLSYLPNYWGIQSSSDPSTLSFFDQTYHAAQRNGASVNMSIVGTAVYLYGSKGPNHGNYSVQFDADIVFLSAEADVMQFQQLLFQTTFAQSSSPHFVSLTALTTNENPWLDLDYITVSSADNTTAGSVALNTVVPPWAVTSSSNVQGTTTSTGSATPTNSSSANIQSHKNIVPEILAICFGSLLAIAIILLVCYTVLRKVWEARRAREHSFRAAKRATAYSPAPVFTASRTPARSNTTGGSQRTFSISPATMESTDTLSPEFRSITSDASLLTKVSRNPDKPREAAGTPAPSKQFSFLSTVPSFNGPRSGKGSDADSMRTDFLQV
ncbi:hypothetical protein PHLCEN_2v917 [Hermanssonia centrifuga]|uniref:Uncharacterized protein n=1 Tax=Hermanssonia centrifuga TaxID=98765 RepID=A0A2R6S4L6_9APHY|nr:hypothetical protein PHLCEN_2v917 [Hermanssonia centrifuga]